MVSLLEAFQINQVVLYVELILYVLHSLDVDFVLLGRGTVAEVAASDTSSRLSINKFSGLCLFSKKHV